MLLLRNLIMASCFAFFELVCRPGTPTEKCIHSTTIDIVPLSRTCNRLQQKSRSAATGLDARSLPVEIWVTSTYTTDSGIPPLELLKPIQLVRLGKQNGSYTNLPKQKQHMRVLGPVPTRPQFSRGEISRSVLGGVFL